jgi:hypothetical protein
VRRGSGAGSRGAGKKRKSTKAGKKRGSVAKVLKARSGAARKIVTTLANRSRARPSRPAKVGPVNEWFELRRSKIAGLGAFALRDIPRGTPIIEYVGAVTR